MKELTMRNTVAEIKELLMKASAMKAVKTNKNLYDRLVYTDKAVRKGEKVTKKDLLSLANDCVGFLNAYAEEAEKKGKKQKATPKGEASVKKAPAKKQSKEEPKAEPKKKAPAKKSEPAKKETAPKKQTKKAEEKKFSFPDSFEDDEYSYEASDMADIKEMREALENDEEIVIATKWTQEDLKQYDYASGQVKKPKKFNADMDLLTVVYVGDRVDLFYAVSMYTEAIYVFGGKQMKMTKAGYRVDSNLPYAIYRATEK